MVEDWNSSSECDSPRRASMYKLETAKPPVKKKRFHHLESVIEQKWKVLKECCPATWQNRNWGYFTAVQSALERVELLEFWIIKIPSPG